MKTDVLFVQQIFHELLALIYNVVDTKSNVVVLSWNSQVLVHMKEYKKYYTLMNLPLYGKQIDHLCSMFQLWVTVWSIIYVQGLEFICRVVAV